MTRRQAEAGTGWDLYGTRTNIAERVSMPTLTHCPWGWACGLNWSWRSRCPRVCGRGFLTVACGLGLRAARLDVKLSSVLLPTAAEIQESCTLEHDISNVHHWNKGYHDLYKELDFLDKLRTIFLAGRLFWLSIPFWKENDKSLQKSRNDIGGSLQSSGEHRSSGRACTNILLGLIILTYVGQLVSKGRVTVWGAKVNSLIKEGQIWRLVTSSFLHADIVHLLVNCYSLNSVGPAVEKLSGPKRFFAVYTASAVAGSTMSYYLCKAPAVGASGAIFGLVGSFAVFVLRHRKLMKGGQQSLFQISRVIAINMVLGLMSRGIDNWGHIGGLIGGASLSWLLGPVLSIESTQVGRKAVLVDKPPIAYILSWGRSNLQ